MGNSGADELSGLGGNDTLVGGAGADTLLGGDGDDDLYIDAADFGNSWYGPVDGGFGFDTAYVQGDTGVALDLWWTKIERVHGGAGADTVNGVAAYEAAEINGGDGDDQITGTFFDDTLYGDAGDDWLESGGRADTLTGGMGNDVFRFSGTWQGFDTITDFQAGLDRIEVAGWAYGDLPQGQMDASRFAFGEPVDADDQFVFSPTGVLSYDPDGSGLEGADPIAQLNNVTFLSADSIWVA